MTEVSTKPYLIRAICDWCNDAGFTPYIAVAVDESVRVPMEFVKNGEIVLNVSALATNRLKLGNDAIEFQARFSGVPREVYVPVARVIAVYARENGQGMAFEVPRIEQPAGTAAADSARDRAALVPVDAGPGPAPEPTPTPTLPKPGDRPKLTRVK
jgi:stringent starvation protein B